jgi:hypothetical protein
MSLKEDTVSADRKERIIFDPEAWKNKDKSGRKTSAITSRQNFDNEKFTRNEKEKVDEGTIQPSGDSKVDSASPTQGDSISEPKAKKSNNPQIEFVSGTAQPNGSSSTATGNAQASATGRKIAEALVKKALTQVKTDKNVGTEEIPFDGPYTKTPDVVVDKSGARHTPMSRVRDLARQALKKQTNESCEDDKKKKKSKQVEEGLAGAAAGAFLGLGVAGPVGALAGGYLGHKVQQGANASKAVKKKVVKEEETDMSKKTYTQFVEQLLEYTPGPGGVTRVQGKSYGANYDAGEDEDDKPAKPAADAPKRGRGRPAGSKSGANLKVTKGKSYGGIATHSLNLPNSNR